VTNSLNVLPEVNRIIMLENGTFVETGTFDELKNLNGPFTAFIKTFLESQSKNGESKLKFYFHVLFY
jgi:ABC-type multidrug transport system fused ATPase/permease subunit